MNDHDLQTPKEPIFSRKKHLLSVGQYASRQGVSTGIVQEAAKLGVVQVRKHKDQTFIVDLPLDTYKTLKQPDWGSNDGIDTTAGATKISELVNKIFQTDRVLEKNLKIPSSGTMFGLRNKSAAIPDLKLFGNEESTAKTANNKNENEPVKFRVPMLRSITDSTIAMPRWKVNVISAAAVIVIIASALSYIIINNKAQQAKLNRAYENIGQLMTEYENAKQKAQMYQFDVMSWQSESERTKKALSASENELSEIRKRLYEARKDLEVMQQEKIEDRR
jgi:hypothetical protein